MNTCTQIMSAAVVAWLCTAAWSSAQVEPEGNLNLLVSNDLLVPPGSYRGDDIVFRNRIGGMSFTATADIIALSRVGPHSFTLLTNGAGGSEALNANDLQFETRTGPKLSLIIDKILFGCDLELGYMAVDGFSLSQTVRGNPAAPLFFNTPLGNIESLRPRMIPGQVYPFFMLADPDVRFNYISRIYSAEANLRYSGGGLFSLLAGFRYVDLHEQLTATLQDSALSPFITSNTDNHMYGAQIGAEMGMPIGKFHLAGIAKAGAFSNQADLTLYGGDEGTAVGGVKGQLAFLGEVDLIGSYCITDNIAVRLGYQAMWLSGVAVAVDQLDMSNGPTPPAWHPNTQSSLFYHGAFLGLEISF